MTGKILVRTAEGVLQEFPLAGRLRIGSGPASDLVIEGDGVLPEHATVGVTEQGGWIEAVGGSRVSINGQPADRRALRHLDVITLGDHVHAIFLTSPVSLKHASRPRQAVSPAVSPAPSATKTIVGLPINTVFTPPADDQPVASSPRTVFGLPVRGLFTPPADDRPAAAPVTSVGIPAVPTSMPGDSSSTGTVTGLPLSALTPPRFDAPPPSQTIKISPVTPPLFTPDWPVLQPIRSVRLSWAAGVFEAPLGVTVIGRGSKSTLRIDSEKISRVHAVVVASRDHVTIEDQGSANGTAVNGVRIKGRHELADGDRLSLGSIDLRVAFIRHAGDK